jgi:hypothetical protein
LFDVYEILPGYTRCRPLSSVLLISAEPVALDGDSVVKKLPALATHVKVYAAVPEADGCVSVPPALTVPTAVAVLAKVSGPLSKPVARGEVVFTIAAAAASERVSVPLQLEAAQLSPEIAPAAATPLSVNTASALLPECNAYDV